MFRSPCAAAALWPVALTLLLCEGALADPINTITLDAAITRALTEGPDVAVERARLGPSAAALLGAEVFPNNPSLAANAGGRLGLTDGPGLDGSVSAQQSLPLFGRWGLGVEAAHAGVKSARLLFVAEQNRIARTVAITYVAAQRSRAKLAVADKRLELLTSVVRATERRLAAGDATLLDVTLWEAELGQAEGLRARLDAEYARSLVRLAVLVGALPSSPPTPTTPLSLDSLHDLAGAPQERPDITAQRQSVATAEDVLAAERAKAWPDVTVSVSASTEGAAWRNNAAAGDLVGGAGVAFALPLFERNQGEIAGARASTQREAAELARVRLLAQAEVVAAQAALAAASRAATILKERVVDKQAASLALLQRAYDAGKLGVTDVLLRQRSVLDAETAYITALSDLAVARVQLAFANGGLAARVSELLATNSDGRRR